MQMIYTRSGQICSDMTLIYTFSDCEVTLRGQEFTLYGDSTGECVSMVRLQCDYVVVHTFRLRGDVGWTSRSSGSALKLPET